MGKFSLGQVLATPGALEALERNGHDGRHYLARHLEGDWGTVPPEDAAENELGLQLGLRLLSSYILMDDTVIWIITEADRSATTILLPDEY